MKKNLPQTVIEVVRNKTPLSVRQKIGPVLAWIYYIDRIYIRPWQKKPNILSIHDTIDAVIKNNLSVIRFGDGEISLIDGLDLSFQKYNKNLADDLEKIIKVRNEKLLICIPGMWNTLTIFQPYAYYFIMHHLYRYGYLWKVLLSEDKIYGDTNMTRHYLAYKDKTHAQETFKKLFSIWENQDIVLIEGSKSRLGVGNDMFKNVKSMGRILCPPENAYSKYEEIKSQATKLSKSTLILLSLGPTAKVLAYDLFILGYRVVDIGHIDMEYEMFLRGELKQVKVPHKYFNEIHARTPIDCTDESYLKETIITIG